ncbi:MAG TPA: hypothetical protein VJ249_11530 [Candidatus Bathyarchaeia archaeon]|nr:hypothetical protein [Candidatus Bathyarchaeia archaeon]
MSSEIALAQDYVESLKQKYPSLDFPEYKLRQWYSKAHQVFFDCKESDKQGCLQSALRKTDYAAFAIFFVAKDQSGAYRLTDASFRNLGTETLEHFMQRFHSQLESMTKLGIQATGMEYIECVGHSYVEA